MPKTKREKSKKSKKSNKSKRLRTNRKTMKTMKRSPKIISERKIRTKTSLNQIAENEIPLCCICEEPTDYVSSLIPRACPYGSDRQHRICNTCWWSGKHGKTAFASENASHLCPGCVKHLPLSNWKTLANQNKNQSVDIIDLDLE